jgi:predicted TIM-barrel fold metal-dependent hydrolase
MEAPLDRAAALLEAWSQRTKGELPAGVHLFDAHLHLGEDVDGLRGAPEELAAVFDSYDVERGFVFCLDEPDRQPDFKAGNDRVLNWSNDDGRLVPFARLDLDGDPLTEVKRCLAAGAQGIKLHPRAQQFDLAHPRLAAVFGFAAESGMPILIHGGRGLPPIADQLADLVLANPSVQLIIAHAGLADLVRFSQRFAGAEGVYFDTSTWNQPDLAACLQLVPPEQILYGSDYPYLQQPASLLLAVRSARLAGADDAALQLILGGNARRIADSRPPLTPTVPLSGAPPSAPVPFTRIHQYLAMAVAQYWCDQPDRLDALTLAISAAAPHGDRHQDLDELREVLAAAQSSWRRGAEASTAEGRYLEDRVTSRLLHLAAALAATAGGSWASTGRSL